MEFDNGTFDIDIYCNMCDSNKYELEYDAEENCVIVTCSDCGNIDRLYFDNDSIGAFKCILDLKK